jgi:hypothetical protein
LKYIQTLKLQVEIYWNIKITSWNIFRHYNCKLKYIQTLTLQVDIYSKIRITIEIYSNIKKLQVKILNICALKLIKDHS